MKWFKKAAEQGNVKAQVELARMYDEGKKVDRNQQEAFKLLKKATEQGSAEALYELGLMYIKGIDG